MKIFIAFRFYSMTLLIAGILSFLPQAHDVLATAASSFIRDYTSKYWNNSARVDRRCSLRMPLSSCLSADILSRAAGGGRALSYALYVSGQLSSSS